MQQETIERNGEPVLLPLKLDIQTSEHRKPIIDSHSLENQMDEHLGWALREVGLGRGEPEQVEICRRYLKHFFFDYPSGISIAQQIEKNFRPHSNPVCMWYETTDELIEHIGIIYQLMYFHYFLGRHHQMKNSFPSYCCGVSTRNLTFALWEAGIVAAVSTYNDSHDHAYTIVPFVVHQTGQKGVILADPTSDQLHHAANKKVRNHLAILPPKDWEYVADWGDGANLYPKRVEVSTCYGIDKRDYEAYLDLAFLKPAIVV
ncbi:MAG: hypothetical protein WAW13_02935 [Minisyncoccia bacterium]